MGTVVDRRRTVRVASDTDGSRSVISAHAARGRGGRRGGGNALHEDLVDAGRQRAAHLCVHVLRHHGAAPLVVPATRLDVDHTGPYVL